MATNWPNGENVEVRELYDLLYGEQAEAPPSE